MQIYLPDLGIELREHMRRRRNLRVHTASEQSTLSPSAQALLVKGLLCVEMESMEPLRIGADLRYSRMTITRAYQELIEAGLVTHSKDNRQVRLQYRGAKKQVWERAISLLRNPVRAVEPIAGHWPFDVIPLPLSGESALAKVSLLAEPALDVFALGPGVLGQLKQSMWLETEGEPSLATGMTFKRLTSWLNSKIAATDGYNFKLESWIYRPEPFGGGAVVDPLSLWLSLKDHPDERVSQALDSLLESIKWQ